MRASFIVAVLTFAGCVSSGAPSGDLDSSSADGSARPDGGIRSDGGATVGLPRDGGVGDAGSAAHTDGGVSAMDAGFVEPQADGGARDGGSPADAGTTSGCGETDLAGDYAGTFDGDVWWTTDPTNREPVSGTLSFRLVCQGNKYGVSGTMTGSESHAVTFSAQVAGEVVPGPNPLMTATIMGNVVFTTIPGAVVPFTGGLRGTLRNTRINDGTWTGHSTTPLVPAEGAGTWQASRR
jgi:hypothetical protein